MLQLDQLLLTPYNDLAIINYSIKLQYFIKISQAQVGRNVKKCS